MFLSPLIIGHEGGAWWESGVCWPAIAGAAAPKVKPPANAAPLLSSALRFNGFEPMRLSFEDEGAHARANEEIACGREYTPIPASVFCGSHPVKRGVAGRSRDIRSNTVGLNGS